ncbi:MAG: CZB domain-containing protein, partial [Gammaproteobacteria bacterium]|nr:CZB domain-containing protein [Gammaproteobacteria bacterium]
IATASEEQSAVIEEVNQNLLTVDSLAAGTVQHADVTDSVTMELARALAGVTIEMQQFRFEQDEQIVFQQAKTAHLAWKARLRNFLDGKEHLSQEQAVSHHHCDLGKWYYGTGMERFGQMAEFKAIEQPHEQIHRLIQQVIALRGSGDEARAESVCNEVSVLSGHIVERIETLANALK